jgi:PAS domain S-box-containing protein
MTFRSLSMSVGSNSSHLNSTQDRLALLLESTGEGIFGIDLDGHCTFINKAGARMLGDEAPRILGQNMHKLTHHSHADGRHYPVEQCPIFNAFRQGLPCRIDAEVFWRKDGSAFSVEYSSYPIMNGHSVLGAVITFVDITERRLAEAELQRAKTQLETRVQERTAELSDALRRLQDLSAHSHKVIEDERTRIAREVHDELGSLLVALKMDVNWLAKRLPIQPAFETMHSKCEQMNRLIESAVDNVGRIITDLRPSILDHQGLWAALEWLVHEFERSSELRCEWTCNWLSDEEPLEPEEARGMAIFRIFQEALSNIGRHSLATRVDVKVAVHVNLLTLVISDDGKGATTDRIWAADSFGMIGMRERARHYGGELTVNTAVGLGCEIQLEMPL